MLVVDDEAAHVEVLLRALEMKGHDGAGAPSVEEAAKLLAAGPFDFVLLDHVLPGKTGMESISRLKTLTRAPIHIMSGYSDDDTRRDAELLGADGFQGKPLDLDVLYAALAALPERGG